MLKKKKIPSTFKNYPQLLVQIPSTVNKKTSTLILKVYLFKKKKKKKRKKKGNLIPEKFILRDKHI
jgi:hypothetical protein